MFYSFDLEKKDIFEGSFSSYLLRYTYGLVSYFRMYIYFHTLRTKMSLYIIAIIKLIYSYTKNVCWQKSFCWNLYCIVEIVMSKYHRKRKSAYRISYQIQKIKMTKNQAIYALRHFPKAIYWSCPRIFFIHFQIRFNNKNIV